MYYLVINDKSNLNMKISDIVNTKISPLIYNGGQPSDIQTIGAMVGVYINGKSNYFPFGVVRDGGNAPDENTVFQIGSVTKIFTTALLGALPYKNRMNPAQFYDSSISSKIPSAYSLQDWQHKITFEQLATFTAGIVPSAPAQNTTQKEFVNFIDSRPDPGSLPATNVYSDSSIGLLGQILISMAGYSSYGSPKASDSWYSDELFTPLSMLSSGHIAPAGASVAGFYTYDELNSSYVQVKQCPWVPWGTAGRVMSNMRDMMNFTIANLGINTVNGQNVPSYLIDGMQQAISPQAILRGSAKQGFAWVVDNLGGKSMAFKNGGLPGASAFIILCPELKYGAVVMANTSGFVRGKEGNQVTHALSRALTKIMIELIPHANS